MSRALPVADCLPADADRALLVGRAWKPGAVGGPCVVAVRGGDLVDLTALYPTTSMLLDGLDIAQLRLRIAGAPVLAPLAATIANSDESARDPGKPWLLAPTDLQALKAAGVTFAQSMVERVIEEQARGDATLADSIRREMTAAIGTDLSKIVPGSPQAEELKKLLMAKGKWSPYLEVGIGPYAEVFTKSQPMSAVGHGADVGLHPESTWNNPEPEVVIAVDPQGRIVGATLGNDVNLRDFEGRSALLLGKAKDNNASCALGPFVRLFDEHFTLDAVSKADIGLTVEGPDNYRLEGKSSMSRISRSPASIAAQTAGSHHQYPDGFVLFLGTMFAPTDDRDGKGMGFTHKVGDVVTISTPSLGRLVNRVRRSNECKPWTYGTGALMRNLAARGILRT
ncbi:MAG: fumarylacetoacetate hydrolase family protein [Alphaproteobacteria bacterium]|nr:fumarylacetoacetate hydrolase family protein [Alphaproteobacteria bacterium]